MEAEAQGGAAVTASYNHGVTQGSTGRGDLQPHPAARRADCAAVCM